MRRSLAVMVSAAIGAGAVVAPAAHAAKGTLTVAGKAAFPDRTLVLTLPAGAAPLPGQIRVHENDAPVSGLQVSAPRPEGMKSFAVMLVIDASQSMRGAAINGAMDAARAFAAQRPAAQPLGIVTFNSAPTVLLSPTTDAAKIERTLASTPVLGSGTRVNRAVEAALLQFKRPGIDAGAVVVLSDGCRRLAQECDPETAASAARVATAARSVNGQVFSVGLRSPSFNPAALRDVAAKGGGQYVGAASAAGLASVYRRIGGQLSNAYVIRYRSLARPGSAVAVVAGAGGQQGETRYTAPQLKVSGAAHARSRAEDHGFFVTWLGVLAVTLGTLLLMFLAVAVLLLGRHRRGAVQRRVLEYGVAGPAAGSELITRDHGRGNAVHRLLDEERWKRLEEALELARIGTPAERFVALVGLAAVVGGCLTFAVTGSALLVPLGMAGVPLLARAYVRRRVRGQRKVFAEQLADSMQAVASAMRTGNSFVGALSMLVEEAPEPTATEFRRVVADERLGVPLEDAFQDLVRRMDNRDIQQVALISVLQRETGGNGAEALDRVVENLRSRDEVRRLVQTLTAQGRMAKWILTGLPIVMLLALSVIGRDYMDPMFHTTVGHVMLVIALALVTAGSIAIEKIVRIEV